jgi:hypothetical protein
MKCIRLGMIIHVLVCSANLKRCEGMSVCFEVEAGIAAVS